MHHCVREVTLYLAMSMSIIINLFLVYGINFLISYNNSIKVFASIGFATIIIITFRSYLLWINNSNPHALKCPWNTLNLHFLWYLLNRFNKYNSSVYIKSIVHLPTVSNCLHLNEWENSKSPKQTKWCMLHVPYTIFCGRQFEKFTFLAINENLNFIIAWVLADRKEALRYFSIQYHFDLLRTGKKWLQSTFIIIISVRCLRIDSTYNTFLLTMQNKYWVRSDFKLGIEWSGHK